MEFNKYELESPIGLVYVVTDNREVRAVDFEGFESRMDRLLTRHYGRCTLHSTSRSANRAAAAVSRLRDYFAGDFRAIENVSVATNGSEFQKLVWAALRAIPTGTTATYGQIAKKIGRPAACRAVGLANGSNPVAIIVPCHRVIGANDQLTGYGGGLVRKEWLLTHEGALTATA